MVETSTRKPADSAMTHEKRAKELRKKEANAKRKKMQNTQQFFTGLPRREKMLFAVVTEDIPLSNTSGLQNVKRKLWKDQAVWRSLGAIGMCGQLGLNCYTVCKMFVEPHHTKSQGVSMSNTSLEFCSERLSSECFTTQLDRLYIVHYITAVEACIVPVMAAYILWSSIYLLCCKEPIDFAKRRHFAIMALPKLASKFSLMCFLHIANVERLRTFIMRGEFRCLASLCLTCMRRRARRAAMASMPRSISMRVVPCGSEHNLDNLTFVKSAGKGMYELLGFLLGGLCLVVGVQALLVKLLIVLFAVIFPTSSWSFQEWVLFLGFVNQLSGIAMSNEVEMLRVLLFRFGGEDATWQANEIEACAMYFRCLAARTVEQLGRAKALALMWVVNSSDMQRLFQGHQRLQEQEAARWHEIELFESLDDSSKLVLLRDQLVEDFQNTQETLSDVLLDVPADERLDLLNDVQSSAVGKLRLAARVQEHIWDWTKVELLEGYSPAKRDARPSVSGVPDVPYVCRRQNSFLSDASSFLPAMSESSSRSGAILATSESSNRGSANPSSTAAAVSLASNNNNNYHYYYNNNFSCPAKARRPSRASTEIPIRDSRRLSSCWTEGSSHVSSERSNRLSPSSPLHCKCRVAAHFASQCGTSSTGDRRAYASQNSSPASSVGFSNSSPRDSQGFAEEASAGVLSSGRSSPCGTPRKIPRKAEDGFGGGCNYTRNGSSSSDSPRKSPRQAQDAVGEGLADANRIASLDDSPRESQGPGAAAPGEQHTAPDVPITLRSCPCSTVPMCPHQGSRVEDAFGGLNGPECGIYITPPASPLSPRTAEQVFGDGCSGATPCSSPDSSPRPSRSQGEEVLGVRRMSARRSVSLSNMRPSTCYCSGTRLSQRSGDEQNGEQRTCTRRCNSPCSGLLDGRGPGEDMFAAGSACSTPRTALRPVEEAFSEQSCLANTPTVPGEGVSAEQGTCSRSPRAGDTITLPPSPVFGPASAPEDETQSRYTQRRNGWFNIGSAIGTRLNSWAAKLQRNQSQDCPTQPEMPGQRSADKRYAAAEQLEHGIVEAGHTLDHGLNQDLEGPFADSEDCCKHNGVDNGCPQSQRTEATTCGEYPSANYDFDSHVEDCGGDPPRGVSSQSDGRGSTMTTLEQYGAVSPRS